MRCDSIACCVLFPSVTCSCGSIMSLFTDIHSMQIRTCLCMWRWMVNFSNMFGFIEAAKDLEPTHCHALWSSKRETGGLATQSEGEHHSPDSFSYKFLLLTRKELDASVCVWSIEYKATLSNPSMLGSMLVHHVDFPSIHGIQVCAWLLMQRAEAQNTR